MGDSSKQPQPGKHGKSSLLLIYLLFFALVTVIVVYEIYSGGRFSRVVVPGVFEAEFKNHNGESSSTPKWTQSTSFNSVPQGALKVNEGTTPEANIWICRAFHLTGNHPGKLFRHPEYGYICNIGFDGQEVVKKQYEVLTGFTKPTWVNFSSQQSLPDNAYLSGRIENESQDLYICRAKPMGDERWHSGKLFDHPEHGYICNIGLGGREEVFTENYQVLTSSEADN